MFERYWTEHTPTGDHFRAWGGDPAYSTGIDFFYVDESGFPVLLEKVSSRKERERRQARRAERQASLDAFRQELKEQRVQAGRR